MAHSSSNNFAFQRFPFPPCVELTRTTTTPPPQQSVLRANDTPIRSKTDNFVCPKCNLKFKVSVANLQVAITHDKKDL
jgi:hypothetical protein